MLASGRLPFSVAQGPAGLWRVAVGAEVNFATVNTIGFGPGWLAALPIMPGFAFMPLVGRLIVTAQAGTHVAAPTLQIGTVASVNNVITTTTITVATLNNSIGIPVSKNDPISALGLNAVFANQPLNGSVPNMHVANAITAGTTLRGHPWFAGIIVPIY